MFKKQIEKSGRLNKNKHKASGHPFQTNKSYLWKLNKKNAYKLEFANNLWLLFLDQLQSDVVVFAIISFQI